MGKRKLQQSAPANQSDFEMLRSKIEKSRRAVGLSSAKTIRRTPGRRGFSLSELMARRSQRADTERSFFNLVVDANGVLRWQPALVEVGATPAGRRAGYRRGRSDEELETVIDQYSFDTVGLSDVYTFLNCVDQRLTPNQGLKKWDQGALVPVSSTQLAKCKKVLLLIHGTFSDSQNLAECLAEIIPGSNQSFFDWANSKYDAILCFGHATLSQSPLINALQLGTSLQGIKSLDIVCHSRGGLIARWWYEAVCSEPSQRGKVIYVGSPLAGTSLAAPDRIRDAIELITNVGNVIGDGLGFASKLVPFLAAGQILMTLFTSLTTVVAKTPATDALIALVPGLDSQSRIKNNFELVELRNRGAAIADYFAVTSSFKPKAAGWAFWKYFTEINPRVKALAAGLVFPGPNDLVVDRSSMTDLGGYGKSSISIAKSNTLDFGVNDQVHHTNYFEFKKTIEFLVETLK